MTTATISFATAPLTYDGWLRATAKVEKALSYGLITTEEATRKLVALDARLDVALQADQVAYLDTLYRSELGDDVHVA